MIGLIVASIILGWFFIGALGVLLAGVVDKKGDYAKETAPIELIFLTGPFGLFLSLVMYIALSITSDNGILRNLYYFGYNK